MNAKEQQTAVARRVACQKLLEENTQKQADLVTVEHALREEIAKLGEELLASLTP